MILLGHIKLVLMERYGKMLSPLMSIGIQLKELSHLMRFMIQLKEQSHQMRRVIQLKELV